MDRKTWLSLCIGMLLANSAVADMSVNTKNWPKQLPPSEYGPHNYYGNGQASSFHKAINKKAGPLTDEEQKTVHGMIPENEVGRYYLKAGIHKSTSAVGSLKNKSTATPALGTDYSIQTLYDKKYKKDVTGFGLGGGYIIDDKFRVDVDYIFGNDLKYNTEAVFTCGYPRLDSKVTGQHLIANAYYEFNNVYMFKPFVGASAGIGMNKVSATFTNTGAVNDGITTSKTSMGIDYGLQIGSRIRILNTRFNLSASYRYLFLGKTKWVDGTGGILLEGKRTFNGFALDLIYLL